MFEFNLILNEHTIYFKLNENNVISGPRIEHDTCIAMVLSTTVSYRQLGLSCYPITDASA